MQILCKNKQSDYALQWEINITFKQPKVRGVLLLSYTVRYAKHTYIVKSKLIFLRIFRKESYTIISLTQSLVGVSLNIRTY